MKPRASLAGTALRTAAGIAALGVALLPAAAPARSRTAAERVLTPSAAMLLDPGLDTGCAAALGTGAAAALCDSSTRGAGAPHLAARGFRMRRLNGTVVLVGRRPLFAGSPLRIVGLRASRRAQLAVLYASRRGYLYARFSRLHRAKRVTVVASGAHARLRYPSGTIRPAVESFLSRSGAQAPRGGKGGRALPCGVSPVGAVCDSSFDALWRRQKGPGWTGADGGFSVGLPDGSEAWLWGDTFLGPLNPNGTRPLGSHLINNSIVIRNGDELSAVVSPGGATLLQVPDHPGDWYWPGQGVVEGGVLRVFLTRYRRPKGSSVYLYQETRIATLSLPDLTVLDVTPVPDSADTSWGNSVLEEGPWTYIYGYMKGGQAEGPRVARAPRGNMLGAWQYFDGSAWSSLPGDAARIASGVPNQSSVVKVRGGYSMISLGMWPSSELVARFARSPTGPFGRPKLLYVVPTRGIYTYNAIAHPEHVEGGRLLVSYNTSPVKGGELYSHPERFLPRFVRIPLRALGR